MGAFGVVELQGAGQGVEDGSGDAGEGSALELGVVLDADAGEGGDLGAPQAGHAPDADVRQPHLLNADLGPPRGEELADLGAVVHAPTVGPGAGAVGCPVSTPLGRDSLHST